MVATWSLRSEYLVRRASSTREEVRKPRAVPARGLFCCPEFRKGPSAMNMPTPEILAHRAHPTASQKTARVEDTHDHLVPTTDAARTAASTTGSTLTGAGALVR